MSFDFLRSQTFWTAAAVGVAVISLGVAIWAQRWAARAAKMGIPAPIANRRFDGTIVVSVRPEHASHFGIAAVRLKGGKVSGTKRSAEPIRPGSVYFQVSDGVERCSVKFDPLVSETSIAPVAVGSVLEAKIASRATTNARSWIKLKI